MTKLMFLEWKTNLKKAYMFLLYCPPTSNKALVI